MKAQIVSFHCILKNNLGKIISSTFNSNVITYLENQESAVLMGLIEGLQDLKKGEKRKIHLTAQKAYGFYDPKKIITRSLEDFEDRGLQKGERIILSSNAFRVVDISGSQVTLDGNHPLAGQDLVFEIEATEARDATPEEIAGSNEEDPRREYLH